MADGQGSLLEQIDENCSTLHPNGTTPLCLPTLLSRNGSQPEVPQEEVMTKVAFNGDATPEPWPKTPTPCRLSRHVRSGFAFGDGTPDSRRMRPGFEVGDATPEVFPEYAPSFQLPGVAAPRFPPGTLNTAVGHPMPLPWPASHSSIPARDKNLSAPRHLSEQTVRPCGVGPSKVFSSARAAAAEGVSLVAARRVTAPHASSPHGKLQDGPPCPAAVYVDLSGLKEKTGHTAIASDGTRQSVVFYNRMRR
jgi:hypothetical protein